MHAEIVQSSSLVLSAAQFIDEGFLLFTCVVCLFLF